MRTTTDDPHYAWDIDDELRNALVVDDDDRRPRSSFLSPINRRRPRSPSVTVNDSRELPPILDDGRRRRPKRRRLGRDSSVASNPGIRYGIRYGHYGQVETGTLKLELISCDGGEHRDPRNPDTYLGPTNVLRHDKSVYCSERPTVNIIVGHLDYATPFCLEMLHIIGPEHGFTAPYVSFPFLFIIDYLPIGSVRGGQVYVAMEVNDLRKYLDQPAPERHTRIQTPPYRARRHRYMDTSLYQSDSPERLTLLDALRDSEVNAALDRRERNYARGADLSHDLASAEEAYYGEYFGYHRFDPESQCDIPSHSPSDEPDTVNYEGEDAPIAMLSDEDVGPEETSSQAVLDFRFQRMRLMRRRHDIENWDRDDRWTGLNGLHFDANDRDHDSNRNRERDFGIFVGRQRDEDGPHLDRTLPSSGHPINPQPRHGGDDKDGKGMLVEGARCDWRSADGVTCTRFHMKPGKYKAAIRFQPGLSGRYILLKLWADRGSNVDIQSVVAQGFGGCRFFPARQFK